jgi:hypothetical protein
MKGERSETRRTRPGKEGKEGERRGETACIGISIIYLLLSLFLPPYPLTPPFLHMRTYGRGVKEQEGKEAPAVVSTSSEF